MFDVYPINPYLSLVISFRATGDMKERSKERLAALLMEELLEQLADRENIKRMFADMTSAPMEELLESLLDEFEHVVEKHRLQILEEKRTAMDKRGRRKSENTPETPFVEGKIKQIPSSNHIETKPPASLPERNTPFVEPLAPKSLEPSSAEPERTATKKSETVPQGVPERPFMPVAEKKDLRSARTGSQAKPTELKLDPSSIELPPPTIDVPIVLQPPAARGTEAELRAKREKKASTPPQIEEDPKAELRKLEEVARKVEDEYTAKLAASRQIESSEESGEEPADSATETREQDDLEGVSPEVVTDTIGGLRHRHLRTPCTFSDDEYAYLHGVALLSDGDEPSAGPFMLEEKGLDPKSFVFASDYEGMRFYLSKINPNVLNISKTMVLLLGKQESLHLRGMHENIINDLRCHGILLPFEFGSVVRGPDDLFSKVDKRLNEMKEALDDLRATTWWTLNLNVLDSRIASFVGTDAPAMIKSRERDRESYTPTIQPKKHDIKMLEKILQKEKKIAETVHDELKKATDRSDIESIVGLGSGSSEDWKPILKASYEVNPSDLPRFFRTITDLQYHHLLLELMLSLTGNRHQFSLKAS